tara:strand:+ start:147 stop:371 length:225 start_codon:yes stop_codon:yes gene_type:complete
MSSLEFVATTELLREIQTRVDSMIFLADINRSETEDSLLFADKGSLHVCLGLVETGRLMVLAKVGEDDSDDAAD